jgi:hypothetical protein
MILSKAQERKSDLRNTSVMEVIIAVILVLLVFVYNNEIEFLNSTATLNLENEKLKDKVSYLEKKLRDIIREKIKLKTTIKNLKEELQQYIDLAEGAGAAQDKLQEAYDKLLQDFDLIKRENTILRLAIKDVKGTKGDIDKVLLEKILNLEAQVSELQDELEDFRQKIKYLEKQIGKDTISILRAELITLREQLKKLGKGKGGSDKPLCQFSFGTVDFLFVIRIIKDNYLINFIPNRKVAARLIKNVDGMRAFSNAINSGKPISTGKFERLAGTIYRWTRRQNPECRFKVKIWDSEEYDKWHRRRISSYFYFTEIIK